MLRYFLRKAGVKRIEAEPLTDDEEHESLRIPRREKDSPAKVEASHDFIGFAKGDEKYGEAEIRTESSFYQEDEDSFMKPET